MEIVLDVQDKNYEAFLEFIKTLDYVSVKKEDTIPQWQKEEVRKRIKNTKADQYLSWEEVEQKLKLD